VSATELIKPPGRTVAKKWNVLSWENQAPGSLSNRKVTIFHYDENVIKYTYFLI